MRAGSAEAWTVQSERGAVPLIMLLVWVALRFGRAAARLFLYPVCVYFLIFAAASRRSSRHYLARALGRNPRLIEVLRHYHCFAACLLDRVFFLNDRIDLFDLRVHGEAEVLDILRRGGGCILLGAHFGSFEVARALGRQQPALRVSLMMYEENARKFRAVLQAINPRLAMEVIGLGKDDSMIELSERLEEGHFVGLLADRSVAGDGKVRHPFLGEAAAFPSGPFRLATFLKRPVLMMFGVYQGGSRYDIFFESLADPSDDAPQRGAERVKTLMGRYVARLEHHCRAAPFNWFNFYDFWA
jgi:predicted LPLAT superfamily acyltransferase